jgi:hypothetical protein
MWTFLGMHTTRETNSPYLVAWHVANIVATSFFGSVCSPPRAQIYIFLDFHYGSQENVDHHQRQNDLQRQQQEQQQRLKTILAVCRKRNAREDKKKNGSAVLIVEPSGNLEYCHVPKERNAFIDWF